MQLWLKSALTFDLENGKWTEAFTGIYTPVQWMDWMIERQRSEWIEWLRGKGGSGVNDWEAEEWMLCDIRCSFCSPAIFSLSLATRIASWMFSYRSLVVHWLTSSCLYSSAHALTLLPYLGIASPDLNRFTVALEVFVRVGEGWVWDYFLYSS